MKRKHLVIIAAVVAVILLILVVVPYLINADNYRPAIESALKSSIGRQVQIGHLHVSLLSRSLTAEEISIADDEAFSHSPFVRAQSLEVGVELLPLLFSRDLQVNGLTLVKPEVTLLRAPNGRWNFASLGSPQNTGKVRGASAADSGSTIRKFSVAELKIRNGRLVLGNLSGGNVSGAGAQQSLEEVDLTAKDISESSSFPLHFSAKTLGGGKLKAEGTVGPIPPNAAMEQLPVHLKLAGEKLPGPDMQGFLGVFGLTLPAGSSLREGSINGDLESQGGLDRLVTTGPVSISKVRLSGFSLLSKLGALASAGGAAGGSETFIQEMSSKVRAAPDGTRLDELNIVVPAIGTLTGAGTISATNELNFHLVAKFNSGSPLAGLRNLAGLGGQSNEGFPFRIRGTTSNPVFVPEFGGILNNAPIPSQGLGKILGGLTKPKKKP